MVKNEIMMVERLRTLPFQLIHSDVEQFAAAVIKWYQDFTPISFYEHQPHSDDPPNLFFMFEYPNDGTQEILNNFIKNGILETMYESNVDYETAGDITLNMFNKIKEQLYPALLHDVKILLDIYHMFYCFRNDAMEGTKYFNLYCKEVWQ